MLRLSSLLACLLACGGCTTVLGEDFQGYVGQPIACDPIDAQNASPKSFVTCGAEETCIVGMNADGTVDSTNQHASCFPITDTLPTSSSCTYANDCGEGAFCSTVLGCTTYCAVGSDCADGVPCIAFSSPEAVLGGTTFGFCAPPCDPSDPHACATGTCSFLTDTDTVCALPGAGALGASCVQDGDCARGLGCDNVAQVCTRYCRAGSTDCGSKRCLTAGEPPLSYGGSTYGYCSL
jgi:hypothetical protein